MAEHRARWVTFYAENVEPVYKEIVSHIEKLIIGTLIVSPALTYRARSRPFSCSAISATAWSAAA